MTWKNIIKKSELVPFPPGAGGESSFLDDLQETFVQSPKNRNRRFPLAALPTARDFRTMPHTHDPDKALNSDEFWPHLIDMHGIGISSLEGLDLDRPDIAQLLHALTDHK